MKVKKGSYPTKRSMNLFYKPDRTTKPATVALYVLFVLVLLLGLGKFLVYDVWQEKLEAQRELAAAEDELTAVMLELRDYNEVYERYCRYSETEEEAALIDRMEVLALLDSSVTAKLDAIAISGNTAQIQFSGVTLAQTAQIVRSLEASPIVAGTVVNTASTTELDAANGLVQANILIMLQKEGAEG